MPNDHRDRVTSPSRLTIFLLLLSAMVIGSIILLSLVPPVSRDALTHHLAVPKLYLQQGKIHELPSIPFSYYPMNLDLLYILPLYLQNDILPKFIHFSFGLLSAWLIFGYLRKRLDNLWALFGALFFLSLPMVVKLSISVYVDLGLVFFSTASLMSIFRWMESRFKLKFLVVAAIWCGLALGTKYNGLIILFILTLFIPLVFVSISANRVWRNRQEIQKQRFKAQFKALGYGVFFCSIALLIFSPWMIRNYVWKANPIYPLYNSFFNSPHVPGPSVSGGSARMEAGDPSSNRVKEGATKWGPLAIRKIIYSESWWEIALVPIRIFFQGQDDNPRYFDGKLNPFLFLLPFFALFQLKTDSKCVRIEKKFLLSFSLLFILYAFFQRDMRIRYIAPTIPPLIILATFGLHRVHSHLDGKWKPGRERLSTICVVAMATVVLFFNFVYIVHQFRVVDPLSYISGRIDRDTYITRYRPEYTVIQYANRHLAANAKILVFFMGNRRYYSDRDLIFGSNMFRGIVKNADSARGVRRSIKDRSITHLLIRFDLFNQWTDKQFDDREKRILKEFFAGSAKQIISANGYGLFELNDR